MRFSEDNVLMKLLWTTLFVLLVSFLFSAIPLKVAAQNTMLSVQPQSSKVFGTEETFNLDIAISGVIDLYAWGIKLYYDPLILNGTVATEGSFLKTGGATFYTVDFNDNYNATHGRLEFVGALLGNVTGISGSGVLVSITFQTKAFGSSNLSLRQTQLSDSDGVPISHDATDGLVEVVSVVRDVALGNMIASPTEVIDGHNITITVTAANEGNKTETFDVTVYYNDTAIATQSVNGLLPDSTIILTFIWDTTGVTVPATYVIQGEASPVADETNLENNVVVFGTVVVLEGIHDIGVTNVTPSALMVYEGTVVNIDVEVANPGDYRETFNVTVYRNDIPIDTQRITLPHDSTTSLNFAWNTTGVVSNATYIVKAVASPVLKETDFANNAFTDGAIQVLSLPSLLRITLQTDKSSYDVEEEIHVYGEVLNGNQPIGNILVALEIRDPASSPVVAQTIETGDFGSYSLTFKLSSSAPNGFYEVTVNCIYNSHTLSNVSFFEIESSNLAVAVHAAGQSYSLGEPIRIFGNVTLSDLPLQDAQVAIEVQDPANTSVVVRVLQTDEEGGFELTFQMPMDSRTGTYKVYATVTYAGEMATASTSFELRTFSSDINGDGVVNILDIAMVALAWGSYPGHPRWDSRCDLDANEVVNIIDIAFVARDFNPAP